MGHYCFDKLFEAEGENKPSKLELDNLTNMIKNNILNIIDL